jgi:hypothetical protein
MVSLTVLMTAVVLATLPPNRLQGLRLFGGGRCGDAVIIGGDPTEVAQALFSSVGVAVLQDRSGAGIA